MSASRWSPGKFWPIQHRRDTSCKQYLRQMTAHARGGLLIVMGIEFVAHRTRHFRQQFRCNGDIDQPVSRFRQKRAIPDCKESWPKLDKNARLDIGAHRKTSDRVVAMPSSEFMKVMNAFFSADRQLDRNQ